jgi:phosphatidylserine/phosphatidylglycerophosphate/cardiolipin synthase-like enzyme
MVTPSDATDIVETLEGTADKLLHSKFLIVDDLIVIGSHNWSAGFYFQFNDWSVVVISPGLTQEMSTRFNSLWDAAAM